MGIVGVAPCSPEQMQRPGEQYDFGARYIVHFSTNSSADVWAAWDGSYVVNGIRTKGARIKRDGVDWLVIPIKGKELLEFEAISE